MESYRKMMKSLLQYQGKDGVWRQLIDHPDSWPETSSTGMFTFAMITGVKNGWLDKKTYAKAARKGWLGLISIWNRTAISATCARARARRTICSTISIASGSPATCMDRRRSYGVLRLFCVNR